MREEAPIRPYWECVDGMSCFCFCCMILVYYATLQSQAANGLRWPGLISWSSKSISHTRWKSCDTKSVSVSKPPTNSSRVPPFPWTYKRHIQSTIKLCQKSLLWPMRSCAVNRQSWRSTEGAIFNCQLHLPLVVDRTSFTIFFKINTHTCYTTQLPECMNNYMSPEYINLWDPIAPMNLYGTLTYECGFPSLWP